MNPATARIKLESGFQRVASCHRPMPSSDPATSPSDAVSGLLQQAAATLYCRPGAANPRVHGGFSRLAARATATEIGKMMKEQCDDEIDGIHDSVTARL